MGLNRTARTLCVRILCSAQHGSARSALAAYAPCSRGVGGCVRGQFRRADRSVRMQGGTHWAGAYARREQ